MMEQLITSQDITKAWNTIKVSFHNYTCTDKNKNYHLFVYRTSFPLYNSGILFNTKNKREPALWCIVY